MLNVNGRVSRFGRKNGARLKKEKEKRNWPKILRSITIVLKLSSFLSKMFSGSFAMAVARRTRIQTY